MISAQSTNRVLPHLRLSVLFFLLTMLLFSLCACVCEGSARVESENRSIAYPDPSLDLRVDEKPVEAPPSHKQRREMAKKVLAILNQNLSQGKANYKFNASGHGVLLSAAGLAFLATGSTTEVGEYSKGLTGVYNNVKGIMTRNQFQFQPTWGCAATCVFLAELHRVSSPGKKKDEIGALLKQYADKIIQSQTPVGGWCHGFENVKNSLGYSHFMFVSSIATHGLCLAKREGVPVPDDVIQKAFKYFEDSSNIAAGRIGYSPNKGQKGMAGPGRTAGGLLALQAANKIEDPLYVNASKYLRGSFAKHEGGATSLLISGHGSAQMGIAWAAWWAAESGCYEEFWAGQGASIAKRQNADGSFKAAPTDGKNPGHTEGGDFANAFHALMLVADYGGLSNSRVPRADPSRSIFLAQQYLKNNKDAEIPESVKKLSETEVQYGNYDRRPLLEQIGQVVEELSASKDEKELRLIPELINAAFTGKVHVSPKKDKVAVVIDGNFVFVNRVIQAELLISNESGIFPKEQRVIKAKPTMKKYFQKKSIIKINKDVEIPDDLDLVITWIVGGKKDEKRFKQVVKMPVME